MPNISFTRAGTTFELPIADESAFNDWLAMGVDVIGVPANSIDYMLRYGFNQSLQDSAAQPKSAATKEDGATPDSIAAAEIGAMGKRLDAIKSGNVAIRGGGGRVTDPVESIVRDLAETKLKAAFKSKGKKVPATKDFNKLRDQLIDKNRAAFESEAKAQLARVSAIEVEIEV